MFSLVENASQALETGIADDLEQAISERIDIMTQNPENIHVTICDYPTGSLDPFVQKIAESKSISIIPCDLESPDAFVSRFDAYYGSASPIAPYFAAQKKPVMIADLGI